MILLLVAVMAVVILLLVVLLVSLYKRKQEPKVEYCESCVPELPPLQIEPKDYNLSLSVKEALRLANNEYVEDIDVLVKEYNLETEAPGFYEKYQIVNRIHKDKYFQDLYEIICAPRKAYVTELLFAHQEFTSQDILLLLMCEARLDNRTMARILFVSQDTLKKRKTRLKLKMKLEDDE